MSSPRDFLCVPGVPEEAISLLEDQKTPSPPCSFSSPKVSSRCVQCAVMRLQVMVNSERSNRALTPSSTAPFAALQGALFEPLALPSQRTDTGNGPLIWQNDNQLTMRTILFDTGQPPKTFCSPCGRLLAEHSCETTKRGEQSRDWGTGQ
ncbi:Hypothetical protein SMAX5B_020975 [Scophthalmus maximus]|uniref:Uncharacterized protein n=1 Tax=Scophthalmus maximus TaxID=52904 RepID=A0A2U9CQP6_SCOMX|nr:Hypothetical protein SMAX5B_020975 [Scophthalmus maximus]